MKVTRSDVLFGGAIVSFLGTLGFSIYEVIQIKKIEGKLRMAAEDIVNRTDIDISDEIVEAAIENAIDKNVRVETAHACKEACSKVEGLVKDKIKDAVEAEFNRQKDDIPKEIKRQIGKIDIDEAKKQVIEEAKEIAKKRFNNDLDDIVEKHNDELESMTRIYESIADRISG